MNSIIKDLSKKFGNNMIKSSDCHYRIEVTTNDGRTQVVELLYKSKNKEGFDASRFVAISPIGPIFRTFNYEEILKHNSLLSVGAICIDDYKNNDGFTIPYLIVRATHLVITAQIEEIFELVNEVAFVADELEGNIYGNDLF